ncbi:MAG TPA: hypothetical protein VIS56_01150 [Candidatus Saccharimonadales bacterium]
MAANIESAKRTDDNEPDEDDSSQRSDRSWPRPPLVPRWSAERTAPAPRVPILLERIDAAPPKNKAEEDEEVDDEEDEGTDKKTQGKPEQSVDQKADTDTGGEQITDSSEAHVLTEEVSRPDDSITEDSVDPLTLEEQVAETRPGDEAGEPDEHDDSTVLYVHRPPAEEGREFAHSDGQEDQDSPAAHASASAGGGMPPRPPADPSSESASFGRPEEPSSPVHDSFMFSPNWNSTPSPVITAEQHKAAIDDAEYVAEKRGLRRGLVAGFLTGYVLKAYLAKRKLERHEKATQKEIDKRDEQIAYLQKEQLGRSQPQRHFEKPDGEPAPETLHPVKISAEDQIFDKEGNEIVLQPGWRIERSSGGYSVVVDQYKRVVYDAIQYGEAFKRDQKREQLSDDVFASLGAGGAFSTDTARTAAADDDSIFLPPVMSDQSRAQQTALADQQQEVDIQHRLPKPRNQVVATVASPWFWTAIAVLLIIYFIAALA